MRDSTPSLCWVYFFIHSNSILRLKFTIFLFFCAFFWSKDNTSPAFPIPLHAGYFFLPCLFPFYHIYALFCRLLFLYLFQFLGFHVHFLKQPLYCPLPSVIYTFIWVPCLQKHYAKLATAVHTPSSHPLPESSGDIRGSAVALNVRFCSIKLRISPSGALKILVLSCFNKKLVNSTSRMEEKSKLVNTPSHK
jgi:hypothetical protein